MVLTDAGKNISISQPSLNHNVFGNTVKIEVKLKLLTNHKCRAKSIFSVKDKLTLSVPLSQYVCAKPKLVSELC